MSIAPVRSIPPAGSVQASTATAGTGNPQARPASVAVEPETQPVTGTQPRREKLTINKAPSNFELPRDVVEVHQDPASRGQVIIQYLDNAGNVILQVPSAQELSVERGIAQEFQQAARLRAGDITAAADAGGKTHGY